MLTSENILKGASYLFKNFIEIPLTEEQAIEELLRVNKVIQQAHGWDSIIGKGDVEPVFNQLPADVKKKYNNSVKEFFWQSVHWRL